MRTLEEMQQRCVDEAEQLNARIERMETYGTTPEFEQVGKQERFRLSLQLGVMRVYLYILNERIHHFTHGEEEES